MSDVAPWLRVRLLGTFRSQAWSLKPQIREGLLSCAAPRGSSEFKTAPSTSWLCVPEQVPSPPRASVSSFEGHDNNNDDDNDLISHMGLWGSMKPTNAESHERSPTDGEHSGCRLLRATPFCTACFRHRLPLAPPSLRAGLALQGPPRPHPCPHTLPHSSSGARPWGGKPSAVQAYAWGTDGGGKMSRRSSLFLFSEYH